MFDASAKNTPVPPFLRLVTIIECIAVAAAALVMFFFPALAKAQWVWDVAPFNSRYIGAIYFAALLPLIVFAISARWSPGRVVLWMIFTFTASIAAVMLHYIPQFAWDRLGTPIWWALYVFLPFNSIFFLYTLRHWQVAGRKEASPALRNLILAIAVLTGLYGVALLLVPESATAFWPWPVDAFHGRIYAATFLTPAVGAFIIRRSSAPAERLVLGLTLISLGLLSILGILWTNTAVPLERQIDYASTGTWAFFAINILCALAGFALVRSARK
jgi:hypothetical protein